MNRRLETWSESTKPLPAPLKRFSRNKIPTILGCSCVGECYLAYFETVNFLLLLLKKTAREASHEMTMMWQENELVHKIKVFGNTTTYSV